MINIRFRDREQHCSGESVHSRTRQFLTILPVVFLSVVHPVVLMTRATDICGNGVTRTARLLVAIVSIIFRCGNYIL